MPESSDIAKKSEKDASKYDNKGHTTCFRETWKIGRPWLRCETAISADGHKFENMFCALCDKWSVGNNHVVWTKVGCTSIRLDVITRHEESAQHQSCISAELNNSSQIDAISREMDTKEAKPPIDTQKVLYFLVQHNLPHTTLFKLLVDLCVELGATNLSYLNKAKNAQYTSPRIVNEFLQFQADTVEEDVRQRVQNSEVYGLMVDEYTDVSSRKHLAMVTKYVDNGASKLAFLQDVQLPNGTADVIYSSIRDYLKTADIDLAKMTSFASDGPSVMVGKKTELWRS